MRESSLTTLLLTLVFVNRGVPVITEHHHSTRGLHKTGWTHEKHDLIGELSGSLNSRFLHVLEEKKQSEQPHPLPLRRSVRSMEDLQGVCDCLGVYSSGCNFDIEKFGPIITEEVCLNGISELQKLQDVGLYNLNDTFPGVSWCNGTPPLLLVSSEEKQSLTLSNVPSVWMCPGSLGPSLHELVITHVPEVKIPPGVLAHRLMDFTLSMNMNGMEKHLIFPRGALSVNAIEVKNVDDVPSNHMENIMGDRHPPQIKVKIENASIVNFETQSVFAPRVWLEVQDTRELQLKTQAVETLLDFVLHVSSTKTLRMSTHAAIINKLQVTSTSTVLLQEESVVVNGSEGEVILQHVGDVLACERAIILGDQATLKLSDVSFLTNDNRVFFSPSPLSSVMLRNVTTDSNSTTFCLATNTLSLHNVAASACLKLVRRTEVDVTEGSRVALCEVDNMGEIADFSLCADPRCSSCVDPERTLLSPTPHLPTTHSLLPTRRPQPTQRSLPTPRPLPTEHHPHHVVVDETLLNEDAERTWGKEPIYLYIVLVVIIITLVIVPLLTWCIYRLCRRSKKGSYELTQQTNKTGTFQRTIVTADNLRDKQVCGPQVQVPHHHHVNGDARELFVSYHASHHPADDHQDWECDKLVHDPDTTRSHQQDTCHQHSSIMVAEDNGSLTSSEIII